MDFLLGPLLLVRDVSTENQTAGLLMCLVLIPGMLIGVVRPRSWSIAFSLLSALAWLFIGAIGSGINC